MPFFEKVTRWCQELRISRVETPVRHADETVNSPEIKEIPMAMIHCRECGSQVSSEAQACPHCGCKTPDNTQNIIGTILTFILIGIGLVFVYAWSKELKKKIGQVPSSQISAQEVV